MCHVSAGKPAAQTNPRCSCGCDCPAMLSIDDEIRALEDHKKIFQERIEMIDTKIAGLKNGKP
ncbi:MAG: hypothetical protein ACYDDV_03145 [Methanoregula sp.]